MGKTFDFCGWATKNDIRCSDGLTIRKDAFKSQNGEVVPLVFRHQHDSMDNVLGHAVLENRDEGVYMYGYFNDSKEGKAAKERVKHGDITQLSIYANQLQKRNNDVMHGMIREVSLVLAGANPGAKIEHVSLEHSDGSYEDLEDEFVFYPGLALEHADNHIIVPVQFDFAAARVAVFPEFLRNFTSHNGGFCTVIDVDSGEPPSGLKLIAHNVNAPFSGRIDAGIGRLTPASANRCIHSRVRRGIGDVVQTFDSVHVLILEGK